MPNRNAADHDAHILKLTSWLQGGNWLWEARAMQGQPAEVREALQQAKRAVEPNAAATSLGDRLVDTLTAQSLDLPPQAAKVCPSSSFARPIFPVKSYLRWHHTQIRCC